MTRQQLKILLDAVGNGDLDLERRRDAIKNLALIIESNSVGADTRPTYEELLPKELVGIELQESEKSELVETLCNQLRFEPTDEGILKELLWAIGKADTGASLNALQCILKCALDRQLAETELRQAILSLEDLSYLAKDNELAPLLGSINSLRSTVLVSGNDANRKAMDSYFSELAKRNIPDV